MSGETEAIAFLDSRIEHYAESLTSRIELLKTGRGETLTTVLRNQIARARSRRAEIASEAIEAGDDEERLLLCRRQHRLMTVLDEIHHLLSWSGEAVGRQDIPVGLLHLVDLTANQVIGKNIDALIFLDSRNMYACIPEPHVITPNLSLPSGEGADKQDGRGEEKLVIFLLPAQSPCNMLLSPIIAHEAAHTVVDVAIGQEGESLLAKVLEQVNYTSLAAKFDTTPNMQEALYAAHHWLQELLCDAVATALTGPSHLLALAAFLPQLTTAGSQTHPPTSYRISACLRILDGLGWIPFLRSKAPDMLRWFEAMAGEVPDEADPIVTIRKIADSVSPQIDSVAMDFTAGRELRYSDNLQAQVTSAVADIGAGIPPVECGSTPVDPWVIVLAGWTYVLAQDKPFTDTLAHAPTEVDLNAMLLKAVELSSIKRLWDQS